MKRLSIIAIATASLVAAPLLASPPLKRPTCQAVKAAAKDVKRVELCRKAPIPPVVDPTPMFLVSTSGQQPVLSDLS